jgi:hypothetical protein
MSTASARERLNASAMSPVAVAGVQTCLRRHGGPANSEQQIALAAMGAASA